MPLPAAVAAALVLAIGVAATATLASLPLTGPSTGIPMIGPGGTLAVEPAHNPIPSTATRAKFRIAPIG